MFLPLTNATLGVLTTEETLRAFGMTIPDHPSFEQWTDSIISYIETHSDAENSKLFNFYSGYILGQMDQYGLQCIDYETGDLLIDNDAFKTTMELCKALYPYACEESPVYSGEENITAAIRDRNLLFYVSSASNCLIRCAPLLRGENTVVFFPLPGCANAQRTSGWDKVAIRSTSRNQANAYEFLKILLSYNIQILYEGLHDSAQRAAYEQTIANSRAYYAYLNRLKEDHLSLPAEELEQLLDEAVQRDVNTLVEIDHSAVYYQNYSYPTLEIVQDCMTPWFEDRAPYETCLAELRDRLTLYYSE